MPNAKAPQSRRPGSRVVTDDERKLFRDALTGVRPIQVDTIPLRPTPLRPPRRIPEASPSADRLASLSDLSTAELNHADTLSFKRDGVQPTALRKLKRGEFPCQSELDLHGRTLAEAKSMLVAFLDDCRSRGARCVRIVHGKGYRSPNQQAVLKPNIAHWLVQRHDVVTYASALPVDGGTGALYVLLKVLR